ncbi:unnamed protein product, partial [Didymodactylos carnosus]
SDPSLNESVSLDPLSTFAVSSTTTNLINRIDVKYLSWLYQSIEKEDDDVGARNIVYYYPKTLTIYPSCTTKIVNYVRLTNLKELAIYITEDRILGSIIAYGSPFFDIPHPLNMKLLQRLIEQSPQLDSLDLTYRTLMMIVASNVKLRSCLNKRIKRVKMDVNETRMYCVEQICSVFNNCQEISWIHLRSPEELIQLINRLQKLTTITYVRIGQGGRI